MSTLFSCECNTDKLFCTVCGRFKEQKNELLEKALNYVYTNDAFDEVIELYGSSNNQNMISFYNRNFYKNCNEWYEGLTNSEKYKLNDGNFYHTQEDIQKLYDADQKSKFDTFRNACTAYESAKKEWFELERKSDEIGITSIQFPSSFLMDNIFKDESVTVSISQWSDASEDFDDYKIYGRSKLIIYKAIKAALKQDYDVYGFRAAVESCFGSDFFYNYY